MAAADLRAALAAARAVEATFILADKAAGALPQSARDITGDL